VSGSTVELLFAWLPLIVIVIGYLVYARYTQRSYWANYKGHIDRVEAINDRLIASNADIVAELREIKEILKDRK